MNDIFSSCTANCVTAAASAIIANRYGTSDNFAVGWVRMCAICLPYQQVMSLVFSVALWNTRDLRAVAHGTIQRAIYSRTQHKLPDCLFRRMIKMRWTLFCWLEKERSWFQPLGLWFGWLRVSRWLVVSWLDVKVTSVRYSAEFWVFVSDYQ